MLAVPVRHALKNNDIDTLENLSKFTEQRNLAIEWRRKKSYPKLTNVLKAKGLTFKKVMKHLLFRTANR
jgi:hypothetical protein